MRFVCLILFTACLGFASDESDYKSNVIILSDGRLIAIRGEMEVIGDEVQFMYANGELMTLPLTKIDLEATRAKQAELSEKAAKEASKPLPQNQTLYDEIKSYQEEKQAESSTQEPEKPPRVFEKKEKRRKLLDIKSTPLDSLDQEELQRKAEELTRIFENADTKVKWTLGIIGILLAFSVLVSLITRIGLIWSARHVSGFWVFILLTTTLAPFIFNLLGWAIPQASVFTMLLGLFIAALQLLDPILFLIYILIHCQGKRLLLLFLFFSPIFFIIALIGAFLFFGLSIF